MNNRRTTCKGFTLTELLVVIVIISLLTLVGIPAFQSIGRAGNLRSATFQVNTALSLARQQAITSRQQVVVVFPDDDTSLFAGSGIEPADKSFRAYALFGMRDGYLTEWRTLPTGVVFDPEFDRQGARNFFLYGGANLTFLTPNIAFPTNQDSPTEMFALGFRPDGNVHRGGTASPTLYLAEGTIVSADGGGVQIEIRDELPRLGITVNGITGQTNTREFFDD